MKKVDTKQWLVLFSLVLLALIAGIKIMKDIEQEGNIFNYSKLETAESILSEGEEIKSRDVYYTLQNIISKYMDSYLVKDENINKNSDTVNYVNYYNILTPEYKKYLGKSGYEKKAEAFLKKFYVFSESDLEAHEGMDNANIIRGIYKFYDESSYLCKLYSQANDKTGYIGITLDEDNSCFYIFYLE